MLWEYEPAGKYFHIIFQFSQSFTIVSNQKLDYELEISVK